MESEYSSESDLGFDESKEMVSKTVTFGDMPKPSKTLNKTCRQELITPNKREKVRKK